MNAIINACKKALVKRKNSDVTVAVTGLSGAGKTTFVTSLVANIESCTKNKYAAQKMSGLEALDTYRLHSATRVQNGKSILDGAFPLDTTLASLTADNPRWPLSTAGVSEIALDLRFWPKKRPSTPNQPTARCRLTLIDYPGEWLADIPLLEQDYLSWSTAALNRLERSPWSEVSAEFRSFIGLQRWDAAYDKHAAESAAVKWQKVVLEAKSKGLKWLQPARFVRMSDPLDAVVVPSLNEEWLRFCPLPAAAIASAKKGSLAHRMAASYRAYQKKTSEFFRNTFKDASRHIILVDVLESLAEGESAFFETGQVLAEVYRILNAKHSGFWSFLNRGAFDRVLLVASKADTVPPNQRASLHDLLTDMCASQLMGAARIPYPDVGYISAVRATRDVLKDIENGGRVRVVEGKDELDGHIKTVVMIDIPDSIPTSEYFKAREGQRTPRFAPIRIDGPRDRGIPNVRLGKTLNDLINDLLQ